MASDWPTVRLGDYCKKIGSGATPRGGKETYSESGGFALIRSQNVYNDGFSRNGLAFISAIQAKALDGVTVQTGDVLVNITGDSVARVCLAPESVIPARVNQHVAIVRPDRSHFDPQFIRYFLASPFQQERLLSLASIGATRSALTKGMLESIEIPKPEIEVQRDLVAPLWALESKVEILRQTNATLEAIAEALFKSWFVDFDPVRARAEGREPEGMDATIAAIFPSELEDSELGPVPKGWQSVEFGEIAVLSKGTVNPALIPHKLFRHYSLPAFDAGQLPTIEGGEAIKSNKTPVPSGAVLVSKLNPHIPRIWFVGDAGEGAVCSTEFLVWLPKSGVGSAFVYCMAASSAFNSAMRQLVTGTSNSHQRVKPDQLAKVKGAVVSDESIMRFEEIVAPILQKVEQNRRLAAVLGDLRDTLLPRLISGKLRLPDAESIIKEVTA